MEGVIAGQGVRLLMLSMLKRLQADGTLTFLVSKRSRLSHAEKFLFHGIN